MLNPATLKLVANIAVTSSVSKLVREVIAANTSAPETRFQQAQLLVGSFAIGGLVAERAWERTEENIDKAYAFVEEWKAKSKQSA